MLNSKLTMKLSGEINYIRYFLRQVWFGDTFKNSVIKNAISTSFFKFGIFMAALININLNTTSLTIYTTMMANLVVHLTYPCIQLHFNSWATWRHQQDGTTWNQIWFLYFLALFVSMEMPKVSFLMDLFRKQQGACPQTTQDDFDKCLMKFSL